MNTPRLGLAQNWKTLGPKLRGKIHIAAGEADDYFLNNAVHLLDKFLAKANPPFAGKINSLRHSESPSAGLPQNAY